MTPGSCVYSLHTLHAGPDTGTRGRNACKAWGAAAGSMHVLPDAGFRPEGWYVSTSGGRRLRSSVFSPTTGALCVRRCLLQPCGLCPAALGVASLVAVLRAVP
jgi:hypothetical protein